MQGQRVPDIHIGRVGGDCVVGQDVEVVDVLATGVGLVGDLWGVVGVECVGFVVAVGHGLGHHALVWDFEALG